MALCLVPTWGWCRWSVSSSRCWPRPRGCRWCGCSRWGCPRTARRTPRSRRRAYRWWSGGSAAWGWHLLHTSYTWISTVHLNTQLSLYTSFRWSSPRKSLNISNILLELDCALLRPRARPWRAPGSYSPHHLSTIYKLLSIIYYLLQCCPRLRCHMTAVDIYPRCRLLLLLCPYCFEHKSLQHFPPTLTSSDSGTTLWQHCRSSKLRNCLKSEAAVWRGWGRQAVTVPMARLLLKTCNIPRECRLGTRWEEPAAARCSNLWIFYK